MNKINSVRTDPLVSVPPVSWINAPDDNEIIVRSFVEELRDALN
jgi:hypothetical protein